MQNKISPQRKAIGGACWGAVWGYATSHAPVELRPYGIAVAALGAAWAFWPLAVEKFVWLRGKTNTAVAAALSALAIIVTAGVIWTVFFWMPRAYYVSYATCGEGIPKIAAQLRGYKVGYAVLNRNKFPLHFRADGKPILFFEGEQYEVKADPLPGVVDPIEKTKRPAMGNVEFEFRRAIPPGRLFNPLKGTLRIPMVYGKGQANLDHQLIVSGIINVSFPHSGEAEVRFSKNTDSSPYWEGQQRCDF